MIAVLSCAAIQIFAIPTAFDVLGSGYMQVSDSELGAVDIYLAVSQLSGYLTLDSSGVPFNASGSIVTGYVFDSSGEQRYTVRWSAWSYAQYRSVDSGYTYEDLRISGVDESNVQWLTYDELSGPSDFAWNLIFMGILFLGVIVCFMRR